MTWFSKALVAWTLAAALSTLAIALASAVLLPRLMAFVERMPPRLRANVLLGWCVAPLALAVVLAGLSFAPTLLTVLGVASDHCGHGGVVPHLCAPPPQGDTLSGVWQLGALLLIAASIAVVGIRARSALTVQRTIGRLLRIAEYDERHGVWIIERGPATVFSAGIGRVHTFISRPLLEELSRKGKAVVLAHERAHRDRRDPLRFAVAYMGSAFHLPAARRSLLSALRLACEQAADEAAARAVGDTLAVADTIVAVEKQSGSRPRQFAMGMVCTDVVRRVEALLGPRWQIHVGPLRICALLFPVAVLASSAALHVIVEHLLGLLIR